MSRREQVATIFAHERAAYGDLSFSSDGSLAALRRGQDGRRRGWGYRTLVKVKGTRSRRLRCGDVSTGRSIATLAASAPVSFPPKGRVLASASASKVRWVFNEDGSGSGTSSGGQNIELWDVSTGQSIATLPLSGDLKAHNNQPQALVFSPDGRLLASQFWDAVQLWDVSEWTPQARLTPDPSEVAFSADDSAWKTFTVPHQP